MRIGESRLGKAILDLCGAPLPRQEALKALSLITDTMVEAHITAAFISTAPFSSSTKGGGGRRQSQVAKTPQELHTQATKIMKSVRGLSVDVLKALSPFVKVLATPHLYEPPVATGHGDTTGGALNMLQHIEKAFYEHEIITAMRCQVSKAVKEKELMRTSTTNTNSGNSAASLAPSGGGYSRKELRRYRLLLQEFDEAVINLKITLGIYYKTLGHQQHQQRGRQGAHGPSPGHGPGHGQGDMGLLSIPTTNRTNWHRSLLRRQQDMVSVHLRPPWRAAINTHFWTLESRCIRTCQCMDLVCSSSWKQC